VRTTVTLNDSIHDGAAGRARADTFTTPTSDLGEPAVDLTRALQPAADLEDDAVVGRRGADG
jgi:hypothetical protein